ncbi:response regulator protein [Streptococcus porcinus]|uniref:response regulator n=1 Tax=Streptococcus porcinus TaxID=1340 RepID=UPI0010CAD0A4|nr:response regulator [Streptococcus porcinus]VTS28960.1 response regulator protein [Streptococcus porcinus]
MNVLIIEDDPMVDFIHRNYLEKINQFDIILSSSTIKDAKEKCNNFKIDLVLLDIHIKDGNGLQFLEYLRQEHLNCEVIIISAANDGKNIKLGFHLGIVDYLIKPFTYERFKESIDLFLAQFKRLNQTTLQQEHIDSLKINNKEVSSQNRQSLLLEKGLSQTTMQLVLNTIDTLADSFTIQDITQKSQLSHVSVRKYITFLEENNYLLSEQIYTKVGRPYRVYHKKPSPTTHSFYS